MIIYKSKFLEVNLLELQYTFHFFWSEYARHMDEEGVYYESLRFLNHRVRRRADQIYLDWRNIQHLISPETFQWYAQYIFPSLFSYRGRRLAILFNELPAWDMPNIIQINNKDIQIQIFTKSANLMQWLLEDSRRKKYKH